MGLFAKKDPICGMKQEKGKGEEAFGKWFCSGHCLKQYKEQLQSQPKKSHGGCC